LSLGADPNFSREAGFAADGDRCATMYADIEGGILPMIDFLGYAAGFLTTFAVVPQIIRVYRLKSAREISVLFTGSLLVGLLCWMVYGIILDLVPLTIWNATGACLTGLLLLAKLKYGR
jgi:MtN3 and saliva related transmembrane protein